MSQTYLSKKRKPYPLTKGESTWSDKHQMVWDLSLHFEGVSEIPTLNMKNKYLLKKTSTHTVNISVGDDNENNLLISQVMFDELTEKTLIGNKLKILKYFHHCSLLCESDVKYNVNRGRWFQGELPNLCALEALKVCRDMHPYKLQGRGLGGASGILYT